MFPAFAKLLSRLASAGRSFVQSKKGSLRNSPRNKPLKGANRGSYNLGSFRLKYYGNKPFFFLTKALTF